MLFAPTFLYFWKALTFWRLYFNFQCYNENEEG